jgi:hypothetical protein
MFNDQNRLWNFGYWQRRFISAPPLAKKTASLIGKETDERPTSNVE